MTNKQLSITDQVHQMIFSDHLDEDNAEELKTYVIRLSKLLEFVIDHMVAEKLLSDHAVKLMLREIRRSEN